MSTDVVLQNKPLVEAIFELRWKLEERSPGIKIDPNYKLLVGAMYEKVKDRYPFPEQMPTVNIPDEMAAHVVQHRFRKAENDWPLVQVGPGIMTLNDTHGYTWARFREQITNLLESLFAAYPIAEEKLRVDQLLLRYIDAVAFDYTTSDVFDFLRDKLKMELRTSDTFFEGTDVTKTPKGLDLNLQFHSGLPKGTIRLRFVSGKKADENALIWETIVKSDEKECPKTQDEVGRWAQEAHNLTHNWFFKMIEGDLRKEFEG